MSVEETSMLPLRANFSGWARGLISPFTDQRIQFGIKMGLAGLLAFYIAQYLRLTNPIWSLLTVMIVMLAKYVGAIAEKSVLRVIGTICGATIATWLIGDHVQNGFFFLTAVGLIVGYCTYRFGGTFYPYTFFLCALTLIVISSRGISDPNQAWAIALDRSQEIILGVLCATMVSVLIWPRYAREDFLVESQEFIRRIGIVITGLIRSLEENQPYAGYTAVERNQFLTHLNKMRLLIQSGSRESIYFKARIGTYSTVTGILTGLHESARDFCLRSYDRQLLSKELGAELDAVYDALKTEFTILSTPKGDMAKFPAGNLPEAFDKLNARLDILQSQRTLRNYSIEAVIELGRHLVALRRIVAKTKELRSLLESLPTMGTNLTRVPDEPRAPSKIDPFWVKNGIKGGIAAVVGLLLCDWIQPPGIGFIPMFAWLFTIMSRGFLGGQGDRQCFQVVFLAAMLGIPVSIGVILIAPFLASYTLLNLFLFTILCLFGFSIARTLPNLSYISFLMLNVIVAIFGINYQQPVSFQTIISSYLGTIIGIFISAIIQRTIWPVLPQSELRARFVEFFQKAQALLENGLPSTGAARYRITLIAGEASGWAREMTPPFAPEGEVERLIGFNSSISKLGHELMRLQDDKGTKIPDSVKPHIESPSANLETELHQYFKNCENDFKTGIKPSLPPGLKQTLVALRAAMQKIRDERLLINEDIWLVLNYLSLVNRYEALTLAVEDCEEKIQALNIEKYWGDYYL